MGDPGLHSKFIEEQQAERLGLRYRRSDPRVDAYRRSIELDIARVETEMLTCAPQRREALFNALKELKWKLRSV